MRKRVWLDVMVVAVGAVVICTKGVTVVVGGAVAVDVGCTVLFVTVAETGLIGLTVMTWATVAVSSVVTGYALASSAQPPAKLTILPLAPPIT